MTAGQYRRWSAPFRTPGRRSAVIALNRTLTLLGFAVYPLSLLWLALHRDPRLCSCVLVPGTGFLAVSLFRRVYDAPRPYEVLDIQPLQARDKRGRSFPSRHVCAFSLIAMTLLGLWPPAGAALLALGLALGWCRVILGVHFPRDVLAGAALGVLWGWLGFRMFF